MSTMLFVIASPNPVPVAWLILLSSARSNGANTRSRNSGVMPIPLSSTTKRSRMVSASTFVSVICILIVPPACVYFMAFDRRLSSIFCRWSPSLITVSCSKICDFSSNDCFFLSISGLMNEIRFAIILGKCTFSSLRLIFPLSILDISSTSLISCSR